MRVLFLALEPPYPPNDGGRIRTYNLLKQVAQEHQATLVAFASAKTPDADWSALNAFCSEIHVVPLPIMTRPSTRERLRFLRMCQPLASRRYASKLMEETLREVLARNAFDVVHVDQAYLVQYAHCLKDLPTVLTHHNVEAEVQRRLLLNQAHILDPRWWARWPEHLQWQSWEIDTLPRFDSHVVVSQQDGDYFRRRAPDASIIVVSNGVDIHAYQARTDPVGDPTLIYVAAMDYPPNAEAVLDFARRSWPSIRQAIPEVRLLVVGRNPPPEVQGLAQQPGIVVTGTVPDVQPYYEQSHALVVPLKSGGGTRLKILEALAAGVAVVSTAVGAEGLALTPGRDFLLADTPQDLAQGAVKLLEDPALRAALAAHGRQTVTARYDWGAIGQRLLEVYEMAIAGRQGIRSATNLAEDMA